MQQEAALPSHTRTRELYARFGPAIFARCRRLLKSQSAAEDATQEVFLRVMRHIEGAPDDAAALGWIYRISTNHCLNVLRDAHRQAEPSDSLPDQPVASFESHSLSRDFTERLFSGVPEKLREPVVMFHVKGMEQAQIARALGVSRRTVLNRLSAFADHARRVRQACEAEVE